MQYKLVAIERMQSVINMELIRANVKSIIFVIILVIGLIASLYLVSQTQIFKSRATAQLNAILEVTPDGSGTVEYVGNNTWKTTNPKVQIRLKQQSGE